MNDKPLALITGASRGIGASISEKLALDGFHVFLNYNSKEDKARGVLEKIQAQGGTADLCPFDVSNSVQVNEKFDWILKNFGPLSVLVNNAGITMDALLVSLKDEELDQVLSIDLKGTIYCTRAATKQMMRQRRGSIIQISSVVGECGNSGQSAYAAAKSGLIGFSKSMALELASRKIRVNVVSPGFIQTEMTEILTEAQKEAILRKIPLGLIGAPEDVASLVAYLASPASQYITGQVIGVNGGMYI